MLFNEIDINGEIRVLNSNESTSILVSEVSSLFEQCKKNNRFNFSGIIVYNEELNSRKIIKPPFSFSVGHYGNSLMYDNEYNKAMFEIQKIPKKLDDINNEIIKMSKAT